MSGKLFLAIMLLIIIYAGADAFFNLIASGIARKQREKEHRKMEERAKKDVSDIMSKIIEASKGKEGGNKEDVLNN